MRPLYVRVHERDNVAIVVNPEGLRAGTEFDCGLVLTEDIPQAHKTAFRDLEMGAAIIRYGEVIGHAQRPIGRGAWVREEFVSLPEAPALDRLALATAVPPALPPLEGYTFEGFRNADGTAGTKNILGITTTVQCVAPTVDYAVRRIKAETPAALSARRRRGRDHALLRLRRRDRRAGRGDPDPHPAKSEPASPISAARRWWSAWAARSCSRRGCSLADSQPSVLTSPTSCRTAGRARIRRDGRGHHAGRRRSGWSS